MQVAGAELVVLAEHHGAFGAELSAVDGDVGGEDGGDVGVETLGGGADALGKEGFEALVYLLYGEAAGVLAGEEGTALGPRQGGYLEGAAWGFDEIGLYLVADVEAGDFQGVEDFYCGGAAHCVGEVVVADEEEDGDADGG